MQRVDEGSGVTNVIRISVYDRTSFSGGATNVRDYTFIIPLPRRYIAAESNADGLHNQRLYARGGTNGLP